MSQTNIDIKDLDLLQTVNNEDRFLMSQQSTGHSAAALTVAKLKEFILNGTGNPNPITEYDIWHAGNCNLNSVPWKASTLSLAGAISGATAISATGEIGGSSLYAGWDSGIVNSVSCSNWFRSHGNTGWFSTTYGGGIHMTDSTYIRTYNAKALYVEGGAASTGIGGHNTSIRMYSATHSGITMANQSYTWGIYSNNNGYLYIGRRTGSGTSGNADKYVVTLGHDSLNMAGNIVATGEITAYSSSDIRLKRNLQDLSGLSLLRKAKTYSFEWTDEALSHKTDKSRHDAGFIAQEIEKIAPGFITHDMWGKGYLGLDKTKFIPYLVAGINELDDEMSQMKRKILELEKRLESMRN